MITISAIISVFPFSFIDIFEIPLFINEEKNMDTIVCRYHCIERKSLFVSFPIVWHNVQCFAIR